MPHTCYCTFSRHCISTVQCRLTWLGPHEHFSSLPAVVLHDTFSVYKEKKVMTRTNEWIWVRHLAGWNLESDALPTRFVLMYGTGPTAGQGGSSTACRMSALSSFVHHDQSFKFH